jgi:hypothetical protein
MAHLMERMFGLNRSLMRASFSIFDASKYLNYEEGFKWMMIKLCDFHEIIILTQLSRAIHSLVIKIIASK